MRDKQIHTDIMTNSEIRQILIDRMVQVDGEASVAGLMNYMFHIFNGRGYNSSSAREIAEEVVSEWKNRS